MALREATIVLRRRSRPLRERRRPAGAWKIAYADFVTAMMAFFLVMWLINTTSPEQKRGIADYFSPATASATPDGAGGVLAGRSLGAAGARDAGGPASPTPQPVAPAAPEFVDAEAAVRTALAASPDLANLSGQVMLSEDPRGLRILLVDGAGRPMFAAGSAEPTLRARRLLEALAPVIARFPHRIAITGHTSSGPEAANADWSLSSARAEAARRVLVGAGVDPDHVFEVGGKAASDPLYPDDPAAPGNRRIAILIMREAPVLPPRGARRATS